jgi:predicted regulator of Ras-like GTPase activity (Roadblock/LC7/MglB family)
LYVHGDTFLYYHVLIEIQGRLFIISKESNERVNFMQPEMLNPILNALNGSSPDIEASAVVSTDGIMIASLMAESLDEERIGAISAAIISLSGKAAFETSIGKLEQVIVKCSLGSMIITHAGNDAAVTVLTKSNANLGPLFRKVKYSADNIAKIL